MNKKIITTDEARRLYEECMRHPELIPELSKYEIRKLIDIAKQESKKHISAIVEAINNNPDYNYPEEYKPDDLVRYWKERINSAETIKHERMAEMLSNHLKQGDKKQDTPPEVMKEIHRIASRRSKDNRSSDYNKIVQALTLCHENTELTGKDIAEKVGVPKSTFSHWKRELDEKM